MGWISSWPLGGEDEQNGATRDLVTGITTPQGQVRARVWKERSEKDGVKIRNGCICDTSKAGDHPLRNIDEIEKG